MNTKLRLAGVIEESITNGPGIRLVLFTQGCPHQCIGCHNPQTHDAFAGYFKTVHELLELVSENPLLDGVTFSGGEPFAQAKALSVLAQAIKERGLNIVTYSGYTYEEILQVSQTNSDWQALLNLTDILIDGPFDASKQSGLLTFRGSENQRIIDLNKSRLNTHPVIMAL